MERSWRSLAGFLAIVVSAMGCGESTAPPATNRSAPAAAADEEAPPEPAIPPPQASPAADGECSITHGEYRSTFTYASGRLQRSTWSRDERVTTYTYEGDRLVRVDRRTPRAVYFTVVIAYDDGGRVREAMQRSPQEGLDGPFEIERRQTFVYGPDGRLQRMIAESEGVSETTTLRYDARGRLVEDVTDLGDGEDASRSRYTYDRAGRLESVDAGTQRWDHRYGPSGHIVRTTMTDPQGAVMSVEERRYDEGGRLIERDLSGEIDRMRYEGTFGSGAECGVLGGRFEGIPEDIGWLGFEP